MTRSRSAARHEVQQALAEFQRGCERFARGMQDLQSSSGAAATASQIEGNRDDRTISSLLGELGPRKPAARAQSSAAAQSPAPSDRRRAG